MTSAVVLGAWSLCFAPECGCLIRLCGLRLVAVVWLVVLIVRGALRPSLLQRDAAACWPSGRGRRPCGGAYYMFQYTTFACSTPVYRATTRRSTVDCSEELHVLTVPSCCDLDLIQLCVCSVSVCEGCNQSYNSISCASTPCTCIHGELVKHKCVPWR